MVQLKCDSSIAIAAFILNTDLLYSFPLTGMFFGLTQMLQVIVIAAPGEFGCYQELVQWVFLP